MTDAKPKNVYQRLTKARSVFTTTELKKTGFNAYGKYNYFQLNDFIPAINRIFEDVGLLGVFNYLNDPTTGERLATMTIINIDDPEQTILFTRPAVDATASNNPIQNAGATDTYLRRYMWLMAMDIVENDLQDAVDKMPEAEKPASERGGKKQEPKNAKPAGAPPATAEQIKIIKEHYPENQWAGIATYFKRATIDELSTVEARTIINKIKEKENAGTGN